jgi:AP-1 complex subunit beta-1
MIEKIESDAVVETLLYKKIAPPLVSLLASEPEIQFVSLRCVNLVVQRYPDLLQSNTKVFFCKYTDPIYIKLEKLDILIKLVSESNVDQVLTELRDYATEIDVEFVRRTVRGIGKIAVKLNSAECAAKCISVLLSLVELKTNYLVQEAVTVVRDIFRKYPTDYELIISALCENLESLDQPEAKASMVWILGEYADRIESAHEILNSFLIAFSDEPVSVQMQLLTAAVKLYLKSPGTGQEVVTEALRLATEESDNPDLRDRAYIYWRMLSSDPEATKQVVLGEKAPLAYEMNSTIESGLLDKLLDQLSLVSSVLHRESQRFLRPVDVPVSGEEEETNNTELAERMNELKQQTAAVERGESIEAAAVPEGGLIDLL